VAREQWNHNIHYHRVILRSLPPQAGTALDVGCGDGSLARTMRERLRRVVGIDLDSRSIELAETAGGGVEYVCDDFLRHPFEPESFDVIASVATLHHMDVEAALRRMCALVRPGGVIAVVGVAKRSLADVPYDAVGFFAHRLLKIRRGYWQHPSPIADPTMTNREIRRVVSTVLPDARYRQHVLFRYSIVWTKPSA
jgi:2-polyprenyl-3-methyl-5-hydroxy-6-metoxy-1,4-benzoquinol methylase